MGQPNIMKPAVKNVAIKKEETLLQTYHTLSESHQQVLQVITLLYELDESESYLQDLLKRARIKDHHGRQFTYYTLRRILAQLGSKKLLFRNERCSYCNPKIMPTVMQLAIHAGLQNSTLAKIKKAGVFVKHPLFEFKRHISDYRVIHLAVHQGKATFFNSIPTNVPDATQYIKKATQI